MEALQKTTSALRNGRYGFTELDELEAPDRNFRGHRDIVTRNLARYQFVAPSIHGDALDIGCGRGYGFDFIGPRSTSCTGIDISHNFLRVAQQGYPHIPLVQASGHALPFAASSFDTIISFEVIEHIEDDQLFLLELRRLARQGAFLAVSTPNRHISSGGSRKPLNPFHVREYDAAEFYTLMSHVFPSVRIFGQRERSATVSVNGLIDRIPISWKYLLPSDIQGLISVALRPPLDLKDCHFLEDDLEQAHTFVALCQV